jgi:hypothetical protein
MQKMANKLKSKEGRPKEITIYLLIPSENFFVSLVIMDECHLGTGTGPKKVGKGRGQGDDTRRAAILKKYLVCGALLGLTGIH